MYAFDFRRPATLADATTAMKAAGTKVLAGGQTLIPTMKQRLAKPDQLIDLGGIADLRAITASPTALTIGAMATHASVAESKDVAASIPGLAKLAAGIGDPHVRNRGTIGGSIANYDPAADYPAGVVALGATINTNARSVPADKFFGGLFATALGEDEIITSISIPLGVKFAYAKFPNPASRYALIGVAVAERAGDVRVVVTGGGQGIFRVPAFEAAIKNKTSLDAIRVDPSALSTDIHADAEYRSNLINVMTKRALAALA